MTGSKITATGLIAVDRARLKMRTSRRDPIDRRPDAGRYFTPELKLFVIDDAKLLDVGRLQRSPLYFRSTNADSVSELTKTSKKTARCSCCCSAVNVSPSVIQSSRY